MPVEKNKLCVVIGRTRHKMVQIEVQEAGKRGAQLIELRLDFLAKAPDFKRLLEDKPCPLVATVRRPADGGRWPRTEEERRMLLRQAIVAGFDWVDLETDVANDIRRFKNVKRIISYHNMKEVPADLEEIHRRMCKQDPDVVKIAVYPQEPSEVLRVLDLLKNPPKPTVALCMGDYGACSRILAGKYLPPFTYAAFNKERGIAPGIPSFDDMTRIYRYEKINPDTKVYGVIGDPVAHSLSPLIHNIAFQHLGMNAVYVPFQVPRGKLEEFVNAFEPLGIGGFSVTIPHKEPAVDLAKHASLEVSLVKAANTLVRKEEGFYAYNTDYHAARESLLHNLPSLPDGTRQDALEGKPVLILGAGGVARAVAQSLHQEKALVTIANRTESRAKKLAEEVGCRYTEWEARHNVLSDVLINCTSVGMHPQVDEIPIHPSYLHESLMVFDTVYIPESTMLIKAARDRGCHVLTGVDMFVRQAALQFKLFTGQEAPLKLMNAVVRRALSPVAIREEDGKEKE